MVVVASVHPLEAQQLADNSAGLGYWAFSLCVHCACLIAAVHVLEPCDAILGLGVLGFPPAPPLSASIHHLPVGVDYPRCRTREHMGEADD